MPGTGATPGATGATPGAPGTSGVTPPTATGPGVHIDGEELGSRVSPTAAPGPVADVALPGVLPGVATPPTGGTAGVGSRGGTAGRAGGCMQKGPCGTRPCEQMHLRVCGSQSLLSQSVGTWHCLPKPHRPPSCLAQTPPLYGTQRRQCRHVAAQVTECEGKQVAQTEPQSTLPAASGSATQPPSVRVMLWTYQHAIACLMSDIMQATRAA